MPFQCATTSVAATHDIIFHGITPPDMLFMPRDDAAKRRIRRQWKSKALAAFFWPAHLFISAWYGV